MRHVLYQTIFTETGQFYFGIHSSLGEDPWYLGSGRELKALVKKHGKNKFIRSILHVYSTREEAELAETQIIQANLNDPLSLNIRTSSKGWFSGRSSEDRKLIGRKISEGMLKSPKIKLLADKRRGVHQPTAHCWTEKSKQDSAATKRNSAVTRWKEQLSRVNWEEINLSVYGWVGNVAKQSGIPPQKVSHILQIVYPEKLKTAFTRTRS